MKSIIKKQFFEYLCKFLEELKVNFKDLSKTLNKYSNVNDDKYIKIVKENLFKHKEVFLGKREELDKFFEETEVELLDGINISKIWNCTDEDNKNAIIQYIKIFVIMLENQSDEKSDNFEDMLKESIINDKDNINEFCKNLENEDNSIINLAKSIADELKDEDGIGDNNIMNLMGKDGKGLNNLISTITSKIDGKLKSGQMKQEDLLSDAQNMMGQNGQLFANLFNGLNMPMPNANQPSQKEDSTEVKECNDVKTVGITNTKKKTKSKSKKK